MYITILYGGIAVIELYWLYNFWTEVKELCRDGCDYLSDPWNYLDLAITVMTQIYMVAFISDLMNPMHNPFPVHLVRTFGGAVVFLLWIKMFYWLRLFGSTAYFIKLILRTIFDLRHFSILIFIIMTAFVTMFFVFQ